MVPQRHGLPNYDMVSIYKGVEMRVDRIPYSICKVHLIDTKAYEQALKRIEANKRRAMKIPPAVTDGLALMDGRMRLCEYKAQLGDSLAKMKWEQL
jgi:hypothetical protein